MIKAGYARHTEPPPAKIKKEKTQVMEKNENGYPVTRRGCENGCSDNSYPMSGRQLAMVYSPYNEWRMIFSPEDALSHGTLFEELYKPLDY